MKYVKYDSLSELIDKKVHYFFIKTLNSIPISEIILQLTQ